MAKQRDAARRLTEPKGAHKTAHVTPRTHVSAQSSGVLRQHTKPQRLTSACEVQEPARRPEQRDGRNVAIAGATRWPEQRDSPMQNPPAAWISNFRRDIDIIELFQPRTPDFSTLSSSLDIFGEIRRARTTSDQVTHSWKEKNVYKGAQCGK